MKQIGILFVFMYVGLFLPLCAQNKPTGTVELLELDETTATFRAEGFSDKKKEVINAAQMVVFYKLFYEGVEGFNDDKKLIENENKYWLENFFRGDRAPYIGFVKGAQLEGDVDVQPTGKFHGFANVVINHESLIRTLKINKLITDDDALKEEVAPKPKREFGIGVRNKNK